MSATFQPNRNTSRGQSRLRYKVINDDVVVFARHDRLYRISNLANNWIPGKFFVLINGNTTAGDFEAVDRINLLTARSRKRCGKLFSELWEINNAATVTEDLNMILDVLTDLGFTKIKTSDDPAKQPRQFGKPWTAKGRAKRRKLARV